MPHSRFVQRGLYQRGLLSLQGLLGVSLWCTYSSLQWVSFISLFYWCVLHVSFMGLFFMGPLWGIYRPLVSAGPFGCLFVMHLQLSSMGLFYKSLLLVCLTRFFHRSLSEASFRGLYIGLFYTSHLTFLWSFYLISLISYLWSHVSCLSSNVFHLFYTSHLTFRSLPWVSLIVLLNRSV